MVSTRLHISGCLFLVTGAFGLKIDRILFLQVHGGETLRPIPGDVLFLEMRAEAGDPNPVDINIYNIDRSNETVGLTGLDPIRNAQVGFEVPLVPPGNFWIRILSSKDKNSLAQSDFFQIYAPNATQNTIPPPTFSEAMTSTTTPVNLPTVTSPILPNPSGGVMDQPASTSIYASPSASSKSTNIIVGATIGGIVFVLLIMGTLYHLSRRKLLKANSIQKAVPFSMTQPTSGSISSLLPSNSLLKSPMSPRTAQVAANRAEVLRRERERLDREIAALEGSSWSLTRRPDVVGGIDGSRSRADINVQSQLETLRAQVRRLETTVDVPPGYQ